jgi:RNA polymerase sigma factor (sigma-70 family)
MERWQALLRDGQPDAAWDALLERYQRLIFAAIRHYVSDRDDVMDVFANVCASLRADDFSRLRGQPTAGGGTVRFSTWLVAVVRNGTVDWLRARDGRSRRRPPPGLSPLEQRVYQLVVIDGRSHREAFHALAGRDGGAVSEHDFSAALTSVYREAPAWPPVSRGALRHAVPLPDSLSASADAPTNEDGERLAAALATLPADERLAVQLYVIEELPAAEVARLVGWPSAKAVYNRVRRALQAMRTMLRADPSADG